MKKQILYLILLTLPFLSIIFMNEFTRPTIIEKPYTISGVTTMNSSIKTTEKCSWNCHNDTNYCKENHVKTPKVLLMIIDPLYFGIIIILQSTGSYGLANIIFLVILAPLFFYVLLVKSIKMQVQMNKLKRENS